MDALFLFPPPLMIIRWINSVHAQDFWFLYVFFFFNYVFLLAARNLSLLILHAKVVYFLFHWVVLSLMVSGWFAILPPSCSFSIWLLPPNLQTKAKKGKKFQDYELQAVVSSIHAQLLFPFISLGWKWKIWQILLFHATCWSFMFHLWNLILLINANSSCTVKKKTFLDMHLAKKWP